MASQNGKKKHSTPRRGTSEWVGFPSSSFLNPIGSSPFNFTNPLSKRVLLIADPQYVNKHTCAYLDTTLHVSGFKVTTFSSLSSSPLFWTKSRSECKAESTSSGTDKSHNHIINDNANSNNKSDSTNSNSNPNSNCSDSPDDAFWEYILSLSDYDCILIPSQMEGDIWNDLTEETKVNLKDYVSGGGCLICCHFRATALINYICDVSWHEISVQIGASYHVAKDQVLEYKNDVRGIVNISRDDVIYKTSDHFATVAMKQSGKGCCYYIGHDFAFLWGKNWNRVLFMAIKRTLTNSAEDVVNLDFNAIDVEAFKNLNIESNQSDIYLEEFQPEFPVTEPVENGMNNTMNGHSEDTDGMKVDDGSGDVSFDGFDELNGFEDLQEDDQENVNPEKKDKMEKEYASIGYIQMDDDGVVTMENNRHLMNGDGVKCNGLDRIDENCASDGSETDNGSLEEVD